MARPGHCECGAPILFDPREGPTRIRSQALSATTWTAQELWSGGRQKVYLQVVNGSGTLIAFRLAAAASGDASSSDYIIDVPAGSGIELTTEDRPYSLYASAAGTAQALVEGP